MLLAAIVRAWFCWAIVLAVWSGWSDCSAAAESDSAATLRRYGVEPTTAGVLGVLRQWRPDAGIRRALPGWCATWATTTGGFGRPPRGSWRGWERWPRPRLREAAKSNDAEVVFRARRLLAECRQGRAEELLSAALEWLRQSPTPQATALLLDLLPVLPDAFQSATREALWVCAGPGDVPRLRQAIGDARPAVRDAAIVALERAAGAAAVRDLEPLLRDKSEAIRLAAARALLDRLPRPSIAALLGLLDARSRISARRPPGCCSRSPASPGRRAAGRVGRRRRAVEGLGGHRGRRSSAAAGPECLQGPSGVWNVTKDFSIAKGNPNGALDVREWSRTLPSCPTKSSGMMARTRVLARQPAVRSSSPFVGVWYGPDKAASSPGNYIFILAPGQEAERRPFGPLQRGVSLRVHDQGRFLPVAGPARKLGIFVKGIPGSGRASLALTIRPGQENDESQRAAAIRFTLGRLTGRHG